MKNKLKNLKKLPVNNNWEFKFGKSDFRSSRRWSVGYSGTLRVFFDDVMISHFDIKAEDKILTVSKKQYCIAIADTGFFVRKRLNKKLVDDFKDLKTMMENGISYNKLTDYIENSELNFEALKNKIGEFLQISYPIYYANSIKHGIKIYHGNSIKEGVEYSDFDQLVDNYENRLMVKSFRTKDNEKVYYRLYLRKERNVILE